MPYANNKGTDQPAQSYRHLKFFIRCLDSIIPIVTHNAQNFKTLASLSSRAGRFKLPGGKLHKTVFS